jgi:hypothetical protein
MLNPSSVIVGVVGVRVVTVGGGLTTQNRRANAVGWS